MKDKKDAHLVIGMVSEKEVSDEKKGRNEKIAFCLKCSDFNIRQFQKAIRKLKFEV